MTVAIEISSVMPSSVRRWKLLAAIMLTTGCAFVGAWAQEVRWAPPREPSTVVVPAAPEHPTEAKVYALFERTCAGCHQSGKLQVARAGGGFAHILDLKRLAADPTLVRPGLPDGSRLYTLMQDRAAPHDVDPAGKDFDIPPQDLDAVRDWISGLKPVDACPERVPLTEADDERAIASASSDNALTTRYLSLRALYNRCASPADLKAYRHAVTVALNSLSWSLQPFVATTIDPQETLIRIEFGALGWDVARWQRLVDAYPYVTNTASVATAPTTLRADWFVAKALDPPLYYDLLGMPDRVQTLQASLKIDAANDLLLNRARRIGIKSSSVARGSRLIQRHGFANGGFWTTFEYAPTPGRPDLFDVPSGPGTRGATKPDASLILFNLPSGYPAFFIANGDGLRLNDLPQSIVRYESHPSQRLSVGAACLACHSQGVLPAQDELKARVQGDTSIPRDIRDKALALLAGNDEMRAMTDEDNSRIAGAIAQSGLVPGTTMEGREPLLALMESYDRDVVLETLAAEMAIPVAALRQRAGRASGLAGDLLERIVHGPVSRSTIERGHASLKDGLDGAAPASASALLPLESGPRDALQLVLKTGPTSFKSGDALTIKARASETCYLTLINVEASGRGTVVFPNDFEPNNLLEAGKEIRVPAEGAPYVFRLRDPGRDTVVGHCMTGSKSPPGITHDFVRQRFTVLGDYRAFLNRTAANEATAKATPPPSAEPKKSSRRAAAPPRAPAGPPARPKAERQARTAVMIDIAP